MDRLHDFLHSLINHFVPHEGNDYRPHLLQKAAFVGLVGMVVLTFTLANFQALLWQSSSWLVGAVLPAVVVELTNEQRTENNLSTLVRSSVLDAAANLKAADMAAHSYFSHNSPTGVTPWHWFDAAGYSYVYAGENLAVYFTDSSAVVEAWMKSPAHRANIVGNQYQEIGVGTAKGTYNGFATVYVVQLFGTRAAAPVTPAAVATVSVPAKEPVPTPAVSQVVPVRATSTRVQAVLAAEISVPATRVASDTPPVARESSRTVEAETTPVPNPDPVVTLVATEPAASDTPPLAAVMTPAQADLAFAPVTFATADFVAMQSGMATAHTDLVPALLMSVTDQLTQPVPRAARLATEPHRVLQGIYLFIGIITLIALFASVIIEWREHRPVQTTYGIALLLLMCGLFVLHTTLTTGALVV